MKIAVIGAGAIGALVAGYLKLTGADVSLVAREDAASAINTHGLKLSGARGSFNVKIAAALNLDHSPDLAILAVKTQDIEAALAQNLKFIKTAALLTTQNGVAADEIASRFVAKENIISSIVMFGATYLKPGEVVHNFEGSWILGKAFAGNDDTLKKIGAALNKIFPVVLAPDIKGMKYLKVFVNANNCIPAILGRSMQEAFSEVEIARIGIAIWKEGLGLVKKAGVKLESLPDFPLERLEKLTAMPTQEAAKIFSGIMSGLSAVPLYGSILQSIKRGKSSEIDYLNGEFVRLARENGLEATLNKVLVEMVHKVEKENRFFSKEELLEATKGLVN
ncbi:MAG: 2-dehydropantoate 2-reductase [Candidatus Omnitrophica bacterium]|nr:2-dehydropantoate 2-reductase [Candidatus Omnitrophota bacterium]MDD5236381.1 2-dehydropantoate 2-reductase [Candidatus Omnitrophota bacterium]MDD5611390.1 2-dehydropantoate 2-reductase [Candidatus Omnitrophota bacterium]